MGVVPVSTQSYVKSSAEPSQEQINFFEQLLKDEASTSNASALLPQVMLTRQMDYMQLTVGVDYLARISGAASQALNKLDNMT
ncbi:EscI/YscI/HrpB family type III secretion system inner rod protein [Salmonella enterica subsp. enterica serovar Altona]|uniref:EscI/YscI/HrpB family type III secretion system inner rod protein n=1 Tax=Salmonella enterica subsp. enterica serovar Mapo TaxID=2564752 RepID=A0A5H7IK88_SALET|nr:EscI/YscI/HrpB family type III secretion system inner rod protein [Salmonella enterica]EBR8052082.1 EscI/YscI/HrpB family type III secretion system inner rod protein [Salmonella enterica subsp. enterica serovar Altona]EBR9217426.1 EscI/YscI/HrpB family type III secretion system inner rod protein [Salmonella enterica subsp. enterica serovar Wangata]ECD4526622.1 EscI/YscI/HrpB family type III secretion system inner rod protein [Salmonella enterica subsp. enterica serovar Mapo]EDQ6458370.1 EscI